MSEPTTIDFTPTWRALVPVLVELAAKGETPESRKSAMDELLKLADKVDRWNREVEEQRKQGREPGWIANTALLPPLTGEK